MLDKNQLVKVKNRNNGNVGYTIPDLGNLHRSFRPGEVKDISVDELRKLHYISGGDYILENYLLIEDKAVLQEILDGRSVEPEYFYSEEDVKNILLNGSLDEFLDCLDFAPSGVIELIKELAVKLEINDIQKRNAIFRKTGLNVNSAVSFNAETREVEDTKTPKRRVGASEESEVTETPAAPTRRVTEGKYKVVSK